MMIADLTACSDCTSAVWHVQFEFGSVPCASHVDPCVLVRNIRLPFRITNCKPRASVVGSPAGDAGFPTSAGT